MEQENAFRKGFIFFPQCSRPESLCLFVAPYLTDHVNAELHKHSQPTKVGA